MINKLKSLKPIETEKEYWEAHKILNKCLNRLSKKAISPTDFINEFNGIMKEGVRIKIITLEFANEQRERIYREMRNPIEFKEWIKNKPQEAKKWIKNKVKKLKKS